MKRRFGLLPRAATDTRSGSSATTTSAGARRRGAARRTLWTVVGAAVVACALLSVLSVKFRTDGANGRRALEDRFATRSAMAADFVEAYTVDVFDSARTTGGLLLADAELTATDLEQAADDLDFTAALVLDADGRVLHSLPATPGLRGQRVVDRYPHLATAVAGTPAVSGVVPSAINGEPIVGFAAPFDTPHGRRVVSGGFALAETPLGAFLRTSTAIDGEVSYLVDADGTVVASSRAGEGRPGTKLDGDLLAAVAGGASGSYGADEDRTWFSSVPIRSTPWRIVRTAPQANVYAPVASSRSSALVIFWLFVGVSVGFIVLLTLVLRSKERVGAARRFLGDVLDAIPSPTAVLGADGRIEHVNAAWWDRCDRNGGDRAACGPGVDYLAVTEADPTAAAIAGGIRSVLAGAQDQFVAVYGMAMPDGSTAWSELDVVRAVDGREGAVVFHADVTERETATDRLRRERERASILAEVATAFSAAGLDVDHVAAQVNGHLAERVGDVCALFLFDEVTRTFTLVDSTSRDDQLASEASAMLAARPIHAEDDNLVAHAWRTRAPVAQSVDDLLAFMEVMPADYHAFLEQFPIRQIFAAPMTVGDRAVGVLVVGRQRPTPYTDDERHLVVEIAERAGYAVTNASLYEAKDRAEAALLASQAALIEANGELERFAVTASHDLRAPLRRIATFSGFLLEDHRESLDEQGRSYLNEIQRNCNDLGTLVTELLGFATLVNQPLALDEVDLGQVAVLAQRRIHAQLAESGADVHVGSLGRVVGDFTLLQRLLENLIANAVTYQPDGQRAEVTISAEVDDRGDTVLSVRDNGLGIDEAEAEAVFRPFKRLVSEARFPGTGLGLALCRRIAERHGGRIWIEPTPGGGTTVRVRLPAGAGAPAPGGSAVVGSATGTGQATVATSANDNRSVAT